MGVDRAFIGVAVPLTAQPGHQLATREHPTRAGGERGEQVELRAGQRDRLVIDAHHPPLGVDPQDAPTEHVHPPGTARTGAAAQHRGHPRHPG